MIKFIRLINNERQNLKILPNKALVSCDSTSIDTGGGENHAGCAIYAYDKCSTYDLAACIQGAHDYCEGTYDTKACIGPGVVDD